MHDCFLNDTCFLLKGQGVGWRGPCQQPERLLLRSETQRRQRAGCARPSREKTITLCRVLSSSAATLYMSTSTQLRPLLIKTFSVLLTVVFMLIQSTYTITAWVSYTCTVCALDFNIVIMDFGLRVNSAPKA